MTWGEPLDLGLSNLEILDFELFRAEIWVSTSSVQIPLSIQSLGLSNANIHGDFELFSAEIPGTFKSSLVFCMQNPGEF